MAPSRVCHSGVASPVKNQGKPTSARIIPYFLRAWQMTRAALVLSVAQLKERLKRARMPIHPALLLPPTLTRWLAGYW